MARRSDSQILQMGIISLALLLLVMVGSFNLQKLPWLRGTTYHAELTDASGLRTGSEVQVAGVRVGRVNKLRIGPQKVVADFDVSGATRLRPSATLPVDRTTPALNLTELFQGFQPLFAALRPEDVNELSLNLIQVLQGEGGTVQQLLANTASLTDTLADRDQLIGDVSTNLSTLMTTVDDHHQQLDELPSMLAKQTRIGVYGSWYNYYLCEFHGGVVLPSAIMDAMPAEARKQMTDFTIYSQAKRCQ